MANGRAPASAGKAVEIYRAPNGRELASLLDKVNLRMPRGKGGVIDWHESNAAGRPGAAQAGVDLASL